MSCNLQPSIKNAQEQERWGFFSRHWMNLQYIDLKHSDMDLNSGVKYTRRKQMSFLTEKVHDNHLRFLSVISHLELSHPGPNASR